MPLTNTAIKSAKPAGRPYKMADSGGLYCLIQPHGGRWWRWDYRRPVTGKRNTLSFGVYPDTSLAAAREKRDEARRQLAAGIDPGLSRKAGNALIDVQSANRFESVACEWLAGRNWVEAYKVKIEAWFRNDVYPWIGSRPVGELAAPDFLAVARRIEQRGAVESAHRVLQNCAQVMRYSVATGRAARNPVADLRGALAQPAERNLAAITEPKSAGALLRALDGYEGMFVTRCALRLAPLLFVRPGELRRAEWSEIDLDAAEWSIPGAKMKMGVPHLVPLSRQAVEVLRELHPLTGGGRFVFPSARNSGRAMSDNAILAALRRMGFASGEMTGHGFRAMARTMLDELLGFRPDIIEHQLAHAVRDPNGRAYNRTSHLPERRRMMQEWADYLDALRHELGPATAKPGID